MDSSAGHRITPTIAPAETTAQRPQGRNPTAEQDESSNGTPAHA